MVTPVQANHTRIKRPLGVTVLGAAGILLGAYGLVAGGLFLLEVAEHGPFLSNYSLSGHSARPWMVQTSVVSLVTFLSAVWVALGIGLWKLRNWARLGVIIYFGIIWIASFFAARAGVIDREDSYTLCVAVALIIFYMSRPKVAGAFPLSSVPLAVSAGRTTARLLRRLHRQAGSDRNLDS